MALPAYARPRKRVWYYTFRVICGLIFFFLRGADRRDHPAVVQRAGLLHLHARDAALDPDGFSLRITATSSPTRLATVDPQLAAIAHRWRR
jgi:putative spermidine/putrescine transport system permease protein